VADPPLLWNAFITNTSDNPVPVDITDDTINVKIDEPIEAPIQFSYTLNIWDSVYGTEEEAYEVPAGKLLVIEFITVGASSLDSTDSLDCAVFTSLNGESIYHYLGVVGPQGRDKPPGGPDQILSEEVKIYAGPETGVRVHATRTLTTSGKEGFDTLVKFSFSGYLVDTS
jgi:hypothetical protein